MARKGLATIVVLLIVVGILIIGLLLLRGNEDTWICQNGDWIAHGKPLEPRPNGLCGFAQGASTTIIGIITDVRSPGADTSKGILGFYTLSYHNNKIGLIVDQSTELLDRNNNRIEFSNFRANDTVSVTGGVWHGGDSLEATKIVLQP